MRKLFTVMFALLATGSLFAGGLVTNTNQSATWVRMPARNASTSVDAVYYNPAGLMKLENGFHFSVSNQSIWQTREVENFYKGPGGLFGLNESMFKGTAKAPLFPSVYGVYKTERLAFSLGFNPIGGGGGATYEKGLPSFEVSASDLVPSLAASQGVTGYRLDAFLEGKSVFMGLQGAVSFKVNDWLSIAAGLRYVMAKNTYLGHLQDIEVNKAGTWTRADAIMTGIATAAQGGGDGLTPLISGGLGGVTATAAAAGGFITTAQRDAIIGGLTQLGVANASALTISQSQTAYYGAQAKYTATATLLGDQEVDAEQKGSGFAPFFSVNITPAENLNIAVKYEMKTRMELENKTAKDFLVGFTATGTPITMFADGDLTPSDMPALLTVGLSYKLSDMATVALGGNYYFDKSANYGHKLDLDKNSATPSTFVKNEDIMDNNGMSVQAGLELNLTDKLLVSGGWSWANKGVNEKYQSDLTYGLATHTFGIGGAYKILPKLQFNVGASMTMYMDDERMVDHVFSGTGVLYQNKETYAKQTLLVGAGFDFSF
jgi:long-subunit fatty acid transport protein